MAKSNRAGNIKSEKPARKKPGPPKTGWGEQVVVRLHKPLLNLIDEWRAAQADEPTRAEAMRRFAEQVLALAPEVERRSTLPDDVNEAVARPITRSARSQKAQNG